MSGENLVKFLLGTLDRVRDRALGVLGSEQYLRICLTLIATNDPGDLALARVVP